MHPSEEMPMRRLHTICLMAAALESGDRSSGVLDRYREGRGDIDTPSEYAERASLLYEAVETIETEG